GGSTSGTGSTTRPQATGPSALPAGYVASKKSDSALSAGFIIDGKAWFFRGTKCFRFDAATSKLDAGFPQDTASAWPGVFDGRIDAAVRAGDNIYFFNGNSYAKWDVPTNRLINIKRIQHNWTFLFEETGVDAGMSYGGKLWFFEGNGIASWDLASDKIDEHFPAATSNVFPGLPDAFKSVDAAFVWPDGNVYFVRGSQAVSYDAGTKKKNGGPFALGSKWKGL
ncbi:MAG: hypothetical protein JST92_05770, partial [Deltaproteobacteria bacterium]|nr:hypothetical protein [Deltaproteobacteria bacterium]